MIWSRESYCSHFRICIANVRLGICKASAFVSPLSDLGMVFVCFFTRIFSGKDLCAPQSELGKIFDAHGAQTVQLSLSFSLRSHEIRRVFVVVVFQEMQFQSISFKLSVSIHQLQLISFNLTVSNYQFLLFSSNHTGPKPTLLGFM